MNLTRLEMQVLDEVLCEAPFRSSERKEAAVRRIRRKLQQEMRLLPSDDFFGGPGTTGDAP